MKLPLVICQAFLVLALLAPGHAAAGDGIYIWQFSKVSDTSYSARVGTHLTERRSSSAGAEIRMRGPDPGEFSDHVSLWASMALAEPSSSDNGRTTRLDARIDGAQGKRRVVLNNSIARSLPGVDARFGQELTLDHEPVGEDRINARTVQTVRLSFPRTRTVANMRAARAPNGDWRTSVGLEQKLGSAVNLTATVEEPATESMKGRVRATFSRSW